jgi:hypothetical protein
MLIEPAKAAIFIVEKPPPGGFFICSSVIVQCRLSKVQHLLTLVPNRPTGLAPHPSEHPALQ